MWGDFDTYKNKEMFTLKPAYLLKFKSRFKLGLLVKSSFFSSKGSIYEDKKLENKS